MDLECTICLEEFEDPRLFACGHTFCLKCVKDMAKNQPTVKCPECARVTNLTEGVQALATNWAVCRALESRTSSPANPRSSSSHNNKRLEKNILASYQCPSHQQNFSGICSSCVVLTCNTCPITHGGHTILPLDSAPDILSSALQSLYSDAQQEAERLRLEQDELSKTLNNALKTESQQADQIRKHISNYIMLLQQKQDELINELQINTKNIRSELEDQEKKIAASSAQLAHLAKDIDEIAGSALGSIDSFNAVHNLSSSLTSLKKQANTANSINLVNSSLSSSVASIQELITSIKIEIPPLERFSKSEQRNQNLAFSSSSVAQIAYQNQPQIKSSSENVEKVPASNSAPLVINYASSSSSSSSLAQKPLFIPEIANMEYPAKLVQVEIVPELVIPRHQKLLITSSNSCFWKIWDLESKLDIEVPLLKDFSSTSVLSAYPLPSNPNIVYFIFADSNSVLLDLQNKKVIHGPFPVKGSGPRKAVVVENPDSPGTYVFVSISEWEKRLFVYDSDLAMREIVSFQTVISSFCVCGIYLFLGTANGSVHQITLFGDKPRKSWDAHNCPVTCLAAVPQHPILISGSVDTKLKAWNFNTGRIVWESSHTEAINCITTAKSESGKPIIVSGLQDGIIDVRLLETGESLATLGGYKSAITCLEIHENLIISASGKQDPTVRVWDLQTRQCLHAFEGHSNGIFHLKLYDHGSKCLSSSVDGDIKLWDITQRQKIGDLLGHKTFLNAFCVLDIEN